MSIGFFDEAMEQSIVKSEIVSKYFGAWTTVMNSKARSDRLAYIDLFSGPGRYKDGKVSTPLKVLETIINRPDLQNKIVTVFNDADPDNVKKLQEEFSKLEGYEFLKHKPIIKNTVVGDEFVELFSKTNLVPTLAFVDPWGYKGLSSRLIGALIKDWGSDCIFFFNYNRINMGITNPIVVEHMNATFGEERAEALRNRVKNMSPELRELTILNDLAESLSINRQNYVLPFRFIRDDGTRTSHYLIFVSKHVLGYKIMKNIMWKYSSEYEDGVASFSYIPAVDKQLSLLYLYSRPLDELGEELLMRFQGKTMSVRDIHDSHHIGTPYVLQNYQEALRRLEAEGKINTNPPSESRRMKNGVKTFSEKVMVTFPKY